MAAEQSQIDADWFDEDPDERETVRLGVMVGENVETHDVPTAFLDQEFSTDEYRRGYLEAQLEQMALRAVTDFLEGRGE